MSHTKSSYKLIKKVPLRPQIVKAFRDMWIEKWVFYLVFLSLLPINYYLIQMSEKFKDYSYQEFLYIWIAIVIIYSIFIFSIGVLPTLLGREAVFQEGFSYYFPGYLFPHRRMNFVPFSIIKGLIVTKYIQNKTENFPAFFIVKKLGKEPLILPIRKNFVDHLFPTIIEVVGKDTWDKWVTKSDLISETDLDKYKKYRKCSMI